MLTCLRVRHFAIIDEVEVELGPGLNVVTGETGAGKSILVDALELVLGGKGSGDIVRTGEKTAEVEALFEVGPDPQMRARLEAAGLEPEEELVIRRVVHAGGRTRAYVNGRLATAGQLATIAAGIADISSQHEHHSLVDAASHLHYLDAFGRLERQRAAVAEAYGALSDAARAVQALIDAQRDRGEREDLLRFQIREIEELEPQPGEDDELSEERERLRHAERLATVAGQAEEGLYAADDALCSQLSRIAGEVRSASRLDPKLGSLAEMLEAAQTQLEEAASDLGRYARDVSLDPDRLGEVEERLDRLGRLMRKYGGTVEAVLAHRSTAEDELDRLERHEEALAEAEKARTAALEKAREVAIALRKARRQVSEKLGKAISGELGSLGMGDARVLVEVAPLEGRGAELVVDGARLSPTGIDRAEFLIAPNRGEEARPLRKVASGGELSRALLAIKRVLADLGPAGLYVFDEVDSGVGGAIAEVIGRKLAEVATHHQVLCITHLPQIAVYGDAHYHVHKEVVDGRTRSAIRRLRDEERLEEIARMLGGVKITRRTRDAAAEMLDQARR